MNWLVGRVIDSFVSCLVLNCFFTRLWRRSIAHPGLIPTNMHMAPLRWWLVVPVVPSPSTSICHHWGWVDASLGTSGALWALVVGLGPSSRPAFGVASGGLASARGGASISVTLLAPAISHFCFAIRQTGSQQRATVCVHGMQPLLLSLQILLMKRLLTQQM